MQQKCELLFLGKFATPLLIIYLHKNRKPGKFIIHETYVLKILNKISELPKSKISQPKTTKTLTYICCNFFCIFCLLKEFSISSETFQKTLAMIKIDDLGLSFFRSVSEIMGKDQKCSRCELNPLNWDTLYL